MNLCLLKYEYTWNIRHRNMWHWFVLKYTALGQERQAALIIIAKKEYFSRLKLYTDNESIV